VIKLGIFRKERNITQALVRNDGARTPPHSQSAKMGKDQKDLDNKRSKSMPP
jgi:hypothetical protein